MCRPRVIKITSAVARDICVDTGASHFVWFALLNITPTGIGLESNGGIEYLFVWDGLMVPMTAPRARRSFVRAAERYLGFSWLCRWRMGGRGRKVSRNLCLLSGRDSYFFKNLLGASAKCYKRTLIFVLTNLETTNSTRCVLCPTLAVSFLLFA